MATYLVTGGCGYLGSRLVGHLMSLGHYVRVLDDLSHGVPMSAADCIELNIGDVCDRQVVERYMLGVDGCFHLADRSELSGNKNNVRDIKATLTGGFNVFSAAVKNKTKVVYISSAAVYGDNAELPLHEQSEPCPLTPYAADKRSLELHAKVVNVMESVPTVGLRLFNVYGEHYPHEPQGGDVISQFIKNILSGQAITIYGDGEQMRDYVYVDDAINFMLAAMEYSSATSEIFNVCSGEGVSVNELARRIMRMTFNVVPSHYLPSRSGDIYGSVGCSKKATQKLLCQTQVSLNEGLKKLIDFYQPTALAVSADKTGVIPPALTSPKTCAPIEAEASFLVETPRHDIGEAFAQDFLHTCARQGKAALPF